jgi:hypothetical protein
MNNSDENKLIDKALAGRLDADEQRLWQELLAQRPDLAMDAEIASALRELPKPPAVSSNFTALVLQGINRPEPRRATTWRDWLRLPRLARATGVAVVIFGIGITVAHRQKQQQEVADSLRSFTGGVAALTEAAQAKPEQIVSVFQDFEAIRNLPANAADVDYSLLAALQSDE